MLALHVVQFEIATLGQIAIPNPIGGNYKSGYQILNPTTSIGTKYPIHQLQWLYGCMVVLESAMRDVERGVKRLRQSAMPEMVMVDWMKKMLKNVEM